MTRTKYIYLPLVEHEHITETSEELSQNASGLNTKFQTVLASLGAA